MTDTDEVDVAVATRLEGATLDCVTVNAWPPTVIVPDRPSVEVFAATVYETEPLPMPDDDVVSHAASLVAVHGQFDCVITLNVPDMPPDGADILDGCSE